MMIKKYLDTIDREQLYKFLFSFIVFLYIFIRLIVLLNSDNFHGIAAGKIICAQSLIKHPQYLESWIIPAHGPVHMYLIALVCKLFGDPYFWPRLISFFAAIGTVFVYHRLISIAFDKKTALLSIFAVSVFSLHVIHSVLSTAAASFIFLLCLGLLFMERFFRDNQEKDLILFAVFISLASMCRFEGGLFIVFCSLFLVKEYKKLLLFFAIASVLPLIWMFFNYLHSANCLMFLTASDSIVHTEYEYLRSQGADISFFTKLFYWPAQMAAYFGWPAFILGLFGIIVPGEKKNKRILLLFLMALSFFTYKTIREELAMQPRYGLSLGFLFVPFFCQAVFRLLEKISSKKKVFVLGLFFSYLLIRGAYLIAVSVPKTPIWLIQAGNFLHQNLKADEAVYVDSDEDNYKDPLKLQADTDVDRFIDKNHFFRHMELMDPLGRQRLKYVVLISKREMHNLKQVFKSGDCKIYYVEPVSNKQ